mgnify:CR=1 FL=1
MNLRNSAGESAIGSEPQAPDYDSCRHWQRVMQGHAGANMVPVVAANRVGTEGDQTYYGHSFITDHFGDILAVSRADLAVACLQPRPPALGALAQESLEVPEGLAALLTRNADGTDNYEVEANQVLAKNLKGKLLLAHGLMDNNVPPYNTWLVVDALVGDQGLVATMRARRQSSGKTAHRWPA